MNNPILKSRKSRGFTFTEILIVLAIIAGVTVLVLSQADIAVGSSEINQTSNIVRSFATAAQQFRAAQGTYAGISVQSLIDAELLPASTYSCSTTPASGGGTPTTACTTSTPFNNADGITIWPTAGGRNYWISLDLSSSGDTAGIILQLHDAFGGLENSHLGTMTIHDGPTVTVTQAALTNPPADSQYWARIF